jgi:heat shock protein HslJ
MMRSNKRMLFLVGALTMLALAACAAPQLENRRWVLVAYGAPERLQTVLRGSEISAAFDSAQGTVSGSAGCNRYSGRYRLRGSQLSIGRLTQTEMACRQPDGVMEQEQRYLRLLAAAQSYQVVGPGLRISCSGGQVLLYRLRDWPRRR